MSAPRGSIGVAEWAAGEPFCTIVCTAGHKKRVIDRIKWAGKGAKGGHLYNAAARTLGHDPSSTAEDVPGDAAESSWRWRCPCGIDVTVGHETLDKLAQALPRVGRIELADLAATLSSKR